MGLCLGSRGAAQRSAARGRSRRIERELYEQAKRELGAVRILLLGSAESGKSTLVKQMKIIHSQGFSPEELADFKPAVLDNLLSSMKFVLHGMGTLHIDLANSKNQVHARSVLSCSHCLDETQMVLPWVSDALCCLWADDGVQAATRRGYEYGLNDSALYFFENMERLVHPEFQPTPNDVLRVRLRTSGIVETHFRIKDLVFRLYDVGGQRSERRKWLGCFEDMRAVLFVASLSAYDEALPEEPALNRLLESMKLFSSVCNNVFFQSTSLILFLNKIDLLQEKILRLGRHLRLFFPQYTGADCDVGAAARFIASLFLSCNETPQKLIYHHFTTATDTHSVRGVFHMVMDTIIQENLEAAALL
ncbi:guanine nucleotide-binding protein G(o) subunit alpha-like isoform X1 [Malaclemys terrapin pileata]|uniref:guanine nucleotide-binding protein G(o) subunit alpha-like isoform X1 n=2 Tax=Malaclemys terrapin pileata TaxID=2991368 RepID=UPI0023A7BCB3|nr:guanine nucleotide-binding protein G(o) subunit alpha-like isoform X1 [Malaclemys terrapin pileata]